LQFAVSAIVSNPATGEPINIKASKKVAFRASKELKMAI
jgi:DNA-binding protein HU-beta